MKADSCSSGHDETGRTSVEGGVNAPSAAPSDPTQDMNCLEAQAIDSAYAICAQCENGFPWQCRFLLRRAVIASEEAFAQRYPELAADIENLPHHKIESIAAKRYREFFREGALTRVPARMLTEGEFEAVCGRFHDPSKVRQAIRKFCEVNRITLVARRSEAHGVAGSPASTDDGQMNEGNPHD